MSAENRTTSGIGEGGVQAPQAPEAEGDVALFESYKKELADVVGVFDEGLKDDAQEVLDDLARQFIRDRSKLSKSQRIEFSALVTQTREYFVGRAKSWDSTPASTDAPQVAAESSQPQETPKTEQVITQKPAEAVVQVIKVDKTQPVSEANTDTELSDANLQQNVEALIARIGSSLDSVSTQLNSLLLETNVSIPTKSELEPCITTIQKSEVLLKAVLTRTNSYITKNVGKMSSGASDILVSQVVKAEALTDQVEQLKLKTHEVKWLSELPALPKLLDIRSMTEVSLSDKLGKKEVLTVLLPQLVEYSTILAESQGLGKIIIEEQSGQTISRKELDFTRSIIKFIEPAKVGFEKYLAAVVALWQSEIAQYYPQLDSTNTGSFISQIAQVETLIADGTLDSLTIDEQKRLQTALTKSQAELLTQIKSSFPGGISDKISSKFISSLDIWTRTEKILQSLHKKIAPYEAFQSTQELFTADAKAIKDRLQRIVDAKTAYSVTEHQDQLSDTFKPLYEQVHELDRKYPTIPEAERRALESEIAIADFWVTYRVYNLEMDAMEQKNMGQSDILKWRNLVADPRLLNRLKSASGVLAQNEDMTAVRHKAYLSEVTSDYKRRMGITLCWARAWTSLIGGTDNTRTIIGANNIDFFPLTMNLIEGCISESVGVQARVRDEKTGAVLKTFTAADATTELEKEFYETCSNPVLGRVQNTIVNPDRANGEATVSFNETSTGYCMRKIDEYYENNAGAAGSLQHAWQDIIE